MVNTLNKFLVAGLGTGQLTIMNPPRVLDKEDSLLLAAYLVAMSGANREEFDEVLHAVENT